MILNIITSIILALTVFMSLLSLYITADMSLEQYKSGTADEVSYVREWKTQPIGPHMLIRCISAEWGPTQQGWSPSYGDIVDWLMGTHRVFIHVRLQLTYLEIDPHLIVLTSYLHHNEYVFREYRVRTEDFYETLDQVINRGIDTIDLI